MGVEGEKLLSISQMAELHGVTRQTLIYYDKIGLFRPACVGENGYRRYAPSQIPFLREICYLRSVGVPLEDIGAHIRHRSPDTAIDLLTAHRGELERRIGELAAARDRISQRIEQYESAHRDTKAPGTRWTSAFWTGRFTGVGRRLIFVNCRYPFKNFPWLYSRNTAYTLR